MAHSSSDIASLIREIRQRSCLTQEEFAAKLGVTFPSVNRWENDRAKPSRMAKKLLRDVLQGLGEDAQDLKDRASLLK